jgi:hypothetical protein
VTDPTPPRAAPSRQGLVELALLVAFLILAAAGTVAVFGDELRAALSRGSGAPELRTRPSDRAGTPVAPAPAAPPR